MLLQALDKLLQCCQVVDKGLNTGLQPLNLDEYLFHRNSLTFVHIGRCQFEGCVL